jgi:hypothetical protein
MVHVRAPVFVNTSARYTVPAVPSDAPRDTPRSRTVHVFGATGDGVTVGVDTGGVAAGGGAGVVVAGTDTDDVDVVGRSPAEGLPGSSPPQAAASATTAASATEAASFLVIPTGLPPARPVPSGVRSPRQGPIPPLPVHMSSPTAACPGDSPRRKEDVSSMLSGAAEPWQEVPVAEGFLPYRVSEELDDGEARNQARRGKDR